jgi:hypothetical protein
MADSDVASGAARDKSPQTTVGGKKMFRNHDLLYRETPTLQQFCFSMWFDLLWHKGKSRIKVSRGGAGCRNPRHKPKLGLPGRLPENMWAAMDFFVTPRAIPYYWTGRRVRGIDAP